VPMDKLLYFAPDATQGSVTKRIVSLQDEGFEVTSFTFTRDRPSVLSPVCDNIDLGAVPSEQYAKRILHIVRTIGRFRPYRALFKEARIFYARLLDVALIATLLRRLYNPDAKLYYEVCDIRRVFVDPGMKGKLARAAERWLLKRTDCLVVNSPLFVSEYFKPVQKYTGRTFILQNKVFARDLSIFSDLREQLHVPDEDRPIVIAWFGNLDDPFTWQAIKAVAERFPQKVRFYLRGYIILDEGEFRAALKALPNIEYGGPFNNRTDLQDMYGRVDVVLGLDLMDQDGNSWWLLPNSLYEAGAYAKPLITSAGTATADKVREYGSGWVLEEPLHETLVQFVETFTWADYRQVMKTLSDTDPAVFAGQDEVKDLARVMRADAGIAT
jgi:succinoglycan biosynthesis protein ExoL